MALLGIYNPGKEHFCSGVFCVAGGIVSEGKIKFGGGAYKRSGKPSEEWGEGL